MNTSVTAALLLLVLPLAAAVLSWLPGRWPQDSLTTATSVASLALVLVLIPRVSAAPISFHIGPLAAYLDALSVYFLLLVSVVALAASFYLRPCWRWRGDAGGISRTLFYSLFNLFHFTMVLVPMMSDLVVLWIGIELTTVTSTVLVAAERGRRNFEAAWKYIIITSTGIIFALLGTLFLAASPNVTSMEWPRLLEVAPELDANLVRLAFLFVLIGYGAKAGLAPMHTWLPDAHGEAPYPVSALLSGVLLKSALYVILRFVVITDTALGGGGRFTSLTLLSVGLLSLALAVPFILKRNRFKRVLAYHSLEHMGIIAVGLGVGGPIALFGALLHVFNHGVAKSLMFLAYGNVQDRYAELGRKDEPRGVLRAMPWSGSMLALGGLALVGSPPFSLFLSELLILWGAVENLLYHPDVWMAVTVPVFLVSVTLIFGGLARHLSELLLGKPPDSRVRERAGQVLPLLGLLSLLLLLGVVIPDAGPLHLRTLIESSVRIICGTECPR